MNRHRLLRISIAYAGLAIGSAGFGAVDNAAGTAAAAAPYSGVAARMVESGSIAIALADKFPTEEVAKVLGRVVSLKVRADMSVKRQIDEQLKAAKVESTPPLIEQLLKDVDVELPKHADAVNRKVRVALDGALAQAAAKLAKTPAQVVVSGTYRYSQLRDPGDPGWSDWFDTTIYGGTNAEAKQEIRWSEKIRAAQGAVHIEIPVTLEATVTVAVRRTVAKKVYGDTPTHPRTDFSVSNGVDVITEVKVTKHDSVDCSVVGITSPAPCAAVSGTLEAGKKLTK